MKNSLLLSAIVVASSLLLSGCGINASEPTATFVRGSALVIGEAGTLTNFNSGVYANPASMTGQNDLAQLTMPSFYSHTAAGELVANEAFGTVTKLDAQSVEYKLAGSATWSDGEPISPADLALSYLAATDASQPGYASALRFTSLALADGLKVSQDSVTVHWPRVPADYQTALPITAAAHVIGDIAVGAKGKGEAAILAAATGTDASVVSKLQEAYATAQATDATKPTKNLKESKLVTAGPYSVVSVNSTTAVLKANTSYGFGPKPAVENVTLRFYSSADDLLNAISAKEVDLTAPIASGMNNLAQIQAAAKKAGFQAVKGDSGQNEAVLLNYGKGGAFNSASWPNAEQAAAVKQMWFDFLPRAGIWSTLAGDKALSKTDSLVFASSQQGYQASVDKNGSAKYQFQDAETSEQLWLAAKFDRTVKLRVLFDSAGSRGQLEYTQLARLGKLGAFDLVNVSTDNPAAVLASGEWDVYITSMGRISTDAQAQALATGALTGFQNPEVTAILDSVPAGSTLDQQPKLMAKLDAALYANFFGLPVFQLDNLVVWSSKLSGYTANPKNSSIVWGYSNWSVTGASN